MESDGKNHSPDQNSPPGMVGAFQSKSNKKEVKTTTKNDNQSSELFTEQTGRRSSAPGAVRCLAANRLGEKKLGREERNSICNRRTSVTIPAQRGICRNTDGPQQCQGRTGATFELNQPPPTKLQQTPSLVVGEEGIAEEAHVQPGAVQCNAKRMSGKRKTMKAKHNQNDGAAAGGFVNLLIRGSRGLGKKKAESIEPEDIEDQRITVGHPPADSSAEEASSNIPLPRASDADATYGINLFPDKVPVEGNSAVMKEKNGGLFLLLVIIVAVVVGVTVAKRSGGDNKQQFEKSQGTAESPNLIDIDPTLIPNVPNFTRAKLLDKNSPQYEAYLWMVEDPIFDQYEDWQITQRFSLATFFYSMGGPRWGDDSTWLDYEVNECEWMDGDNICDQEMTIKLINITKQRGFKGSLPKEVALLTRLEGLDFSNNVLGGDLTGLFDNYFGYDALQVFRCSECRLSGSIPVEFAQMTSLQQVVLNTNDLTGELPSEIGQLQDIRELELEGNKVIGAIPTTIGAIKSLASLKLRDNQFSSIPSEVGKLSALERLDVGNNHIRQSIPSELGVLEKLQVLELDQNTFHNEVPSELGQLSNLKRLLLNLNELTGSIPEELYSLSNLRLLWMQSNDFGGSLPASIGQMTSLTKLDLGLNMLTSTAPSELGRLVELRELRLYENKLTGTIPSDIARLPRLVMFDLWGNPAISRELPGEFCPSPPAQLKTDWCSGFSCCT